MFSYGGHDCLDLGGRWNVVKNNVFHNEEAYYRKHITARCCPATTPSSGYFGNREHPASRTPATNHRNGLSTTLIEGNRIGYRRDAAGRRRLLRDRERGCPYAWSASTTSTATAAWVITARCNRRAVQTTSSERSGSWGRGL
ncbi:MAG: hypothetical protein M0C28_27760 [Candidatus Moduliflexus flocculans]|nr:hypothetical protein [Candidatus Moduliflexus flocculans]